MKKVIVIVIFWVTVLIVASLFFLNNYDAINQWLMQLDEMAERSNDVSLQLITSVLWTCVFIVLKPVAIWSFLVFLVVLCWYAVENGFKNSRSNGYRIFSGAVIPFFVCIYIDSVELSSFQKHGIFIFCCAAGYLLLTMLSRAKEEILYYALLAFFSSSVILMFVYMFKYLEGTSAIAGSMGFAVGFLLNIVLNGFDEDKPLLDLFDKCFDMCLSAINNTKKIRLFSKPNSYKKQDEGLSVD